MLTTRIIGVINILNDIAVQSINFTHYLPIGNPKIAVDYFDKWGIDEIVILDINGSNKESSDLHHHLPKYIIDCQTPVAAGGGVRNLFDIENLIRNGADKVVINSNAHINPKIIEQGSKEFGEQAIIISIDVRKEGNEYIVFGNSGLNRLDLSLEEIILQAQDFGAGEIIINSIDRDGSKKGFDIKLFKLVKNLVSMPIIGIGGAGEPGHFVDALSSGTSGLAAGNFFHFTEHSVLMLKSYLVKNHHDIRLDTHADYTNAEFGLNNRLSSLSDKELESLRFDYIPQEKI
jgi:imidazole glycerol-phosphate synthase subunit HisF